MVVRRARGRTAGASPPSCSTASEETAHGVHAPAGGVLARRPEVIAGSRSERPLEPRPVLNASVQNSPTLGLWRRGASSSSRSPAVRPASYWE